MLAVFPKNTADPLVTQRNMRLVSSPNKAPIPSATAEHRVPDVLKVVHR